MSRIGKLPIELKSGAEVNIENNEVKVKGPKGELSYTVDKSLGVVKEGEAILVSIKKQSDSARKLFGLSRTLIANMVKGVSDGFEKTLEFKGTGYRAGVDGNDVVLNMGFSHPVNLQMPEGISVRVEKNHIIVSGFDKQAVGQFAAKIRDVKKPEPYKGKGIKYKNEVIRRKAGKTAGK